MEIDKTIAKTDVDDPVNVTDPNVSDPSSDKEEDTADDVDIDAMSEEELRVFAKNEREAKQRMVQSTREQARKHRADLEDLSKPQPKATELPDNLDEIIDQKVEARVAETVKTKQMDSFSEGSTDWLYNQAWGKRFAPESAGSTELYTALHREAKRRVDQRIADGKPIKDQADYRHILALAAVEVTGDATPLLPTKDDGARYEDAQKRAATGIVGGGSGQGKSKVILNARQRQMAIDAGHDPEDPALLAHYSKQ